MPSNLVEKVLELKGLIGIGAVVLAVAGAGVKLAKVPARFDTHIAQMDTLLAEQHETNRILGQLLCIEAKLDTPARCGYRK